MGHGSHQVEKEILQGLIRPCLLLNAQRDSKGGMGEGWGGGV